MRKNIFAVLFGVLFLSACDVQTSQRLNFFNWGDYIDETVIEEFEAETGVEVKIDYYDSNETMYAKLKSGGANYDLCVPSDYMIERLIKEKMLEKIDTSKISNVKNIDERLLNREYDPENAYSVPYMQGTFGILYNKTMVKERVDSFDILWDEKYAGQIFMYDSVRDSMAVSLKRLGYSLNTTDPAQITEAKEEMIKQLDIVLAYSGDLIKENMASGQAALAAVYSGDAMYAMKINPDLDYVIPKEGSNVWNDAFVIPKGASNIENAHKFIDFLSRPGVAARNSEYIGYTTANKAALPLLPVETSSDPAYWVSDEDYERLEFFRDLGGAIKLYDDAWTEIFSAN
jgi:spermidine/putrescine-binding protein